ncbi:hypothetical protein ONE63_010356 [Megalurothrips usitatus]|uniref:Uncharacterized protein n=1 Tax=Megalurothrips usitatus TaxID=439358 RepID=A0AAV7XHL2_9NEOP|nr:hypothetical protein ONE63_010356 [Megalurothrips usitatus]
MFTDAALHEVIRLPPRAREGGAGEAAKQRQPVPPGLLHVRAHLHLQRQLRADSPGSPAGGGAPRLHLRSVRLHHGHGGRTQRPAALLRRRGHRPHRVDEPERAASLLGHVLDHHNADGPRQRRALCGHLHCPALLELCVCRVDALPNKQIRSGLVERVHARDFLPGLEPVRQELAAEVRVQGAAGARPERHRRQAHHRRRVRRRPRDAAGRHAGLRRPLLLLPLRLRHR